MKLELNKVYKDRQGTQWKVFCITSEDEHRWKVICATDQTQTRFNRYTRDGRNCDGELHPTTDLIELVGDDFKKEPFKIQFEGTVISYEADHGGYKQSITLSPHRTASFDFEIFIQLHKYHSRLHSCKITIEEIEE